MERNYDREEFVEDAKAEISGGQESVIEADEQDIETGVRLAETLDCPEVCDEDGTSDVPESGEKKSPKPLYKNWRLWIGIAILLYGIVGYFLEKYGISIRF